MASKGITESVGVARRYVDDAQEATAGMGATTRIFGSGPDVPAQGAARFSWEYDGSRDRLLSLYQKGKDKQWDTTKRIDWSLEVDPNNPIGIGIYLSCYAGTAASMCGLLILGLRAGTAHLTEDERLRVKGNLVRYVALLAVMLSGLIALRMGGFQAAGGALLAIVPAMLLAHLVTQRMKRASAARA